MSGRDDKTPSWGLGRFARPRPEPDKPETLGERFNREWHEEGDRRLREERERRASMWRHVLQPDPFKAQEEARTAQARLRAQTQALRQALEDELLGLQFERERKAAAGHIPGRDPLSVPLVETVLRLHDEGKSWKAIAAELKGVFSYRKVDYVRIAVKHDDIGWNRGQIIFGPMTENTAAGIALPKR